MSNKDRLLSDEELHKELERILSGGIHAKGSDKGGYPTYFTKPYYLWIEDRINVALDLINTQKRLYAESVKDKKLYVPSLTEETYKYLKALHDPYMYGDRAYYSYKHLADRAELSIEKCKELTKLFKVLGLVESKRGLMTEDGEVYGSGIGIPYGNQEAVAECAILRYENELRAEQRKRVNDE